MILDNLLALGTLGAATGSDSINMEMVGNQQEVLDLFQLKAHSALEPHDAHFLIKGSSLCSKSGQYMACRKMFDKLRIG